MLLRVNEKLKQLQTSRKRKIKTYYYYDCEWQITLKQKFIGSNLIDLTNEIYNWSN